MCASVQDLVVLTPSDGLNIQSLHVMKLVRTARHVDFQNSSLEYEKYVESPT